MTVISESFNNGALIRLTETETGLSTSYYQHGDRYTERIRAEARLDFLVESRKRQLERISKESYTFSEALHEVITNGKGMCLDIHETEGPYDDVKILPNPEIIRVNWPSYDDNMQLPFLYIEGCRGNVPWVIDVYAPFARWRVVD